jgi:uncharacterized membrane-anchored protein
MKKEMLNKVPQVTLIFWLIKIMATTVGETAADYLIFKVHLGLVVTSLIMILPLAVSLLIQFKSKRYTPWIYWLAVVFISIVGTLITDNLTDNYNIPLETSTIVFAILLAGTFYVWYNKEKTLSIHTIYAGRREMFYWLAILFTFAVGTAAGDLISEEHNVGYLNSAILFGGLIAVTTLCYYKFKLNAVAAFWIAYILTRPLGASLGDLLSKSHKHGGFGFGVTNTSYVFFGIIICLVLYLTIKEKDRPATQS